MAVQQTTAGELVRGAGAADILKRKPQTYWSMARTALSRDRLTIVATRSTPCSRTRSRRKHNF